MHLPLHVISQHAGLIFQHLVDKTVFKPRQVALLIPTETKKMNFWHQPALLADV